MTPALTAPLPPLAPRRQAIRFLRQPLHGPGFGASRASPLSRWARRAIALAALLLSFAAAAADLRAGALDADFAARRDAILAAQVARPLYGAFRVERLPFTSP